MLRRNLAAFGHRLMMDYVVPGGVARDLGPERMEPLRAQCAGLEREIHILRDIYDEHAGLQDRFRNCGNISTALAAKLGDHGIGRTRERTRARPASRPSVVPYETLEVRIAGATDGDVAARAAVRFDELRESLRLVRTIVDALPDAPDGMVRTPLPEIGAFKLGLGYVEGWRGPVLVALESGPDGTIRRCHAHDPSSINWPVIEHAVIGNIVPDFPLINKSFNLSYSGQDLRTDRARDATNAMLYILRQIARTGIRTEPAPAPDEDMIVVARLQQKVLRTLGRALTIRQVDAGSCNGCELEIHALGNPYYNIEELGTKFVASPRHADMLLRDRPGDQAHGHRAEADLRGDAGPKLVVAVGDCGCTGGIFGESYASLGRVANVIPVDVEIPGCPPTPVALLQGILAALVRAAPKLPPGESGPATL